MVGTEFWYEEGNSRREGREGSERQSKRWWLPSPQVPVGGLSETARKKLLSQVNVVQQVFKAAKSINDNVLSDMPIPNVIQDALSKASHLLSSFNFLICWTLFPPPRLSYSAYSADHLCENAVWKGGFGGGSVQNLSIRNKVCS